MEILKKLEKSANFKGTPRHFGLEIEYAGIPLAKSAALIAEVLGAESICDHTTHYTLRHPHMGDFTVELDVELAQKISKRAKQAKEADDDPLDINSLTDTVVSEALGTIAPSEIVTPPLEAQDLNCVADIIETLRKNGAKGTSDSLFYAFGYHVNPEVRSTEAKDILQIIRSYALLHEVLVDLLDMDFTRRMSGYAAPYDIKYIKCILDNDYNPDMTRLMTDYMRYNDSRNYALDLLPLFRFIDKDQVDRTCPSSLIKTRPTYHFRLPNSSVSDKGWNIYFGLEAWHLVETVADNPDILKALSDMYLRAHETMLSEVVNDWPQQCLEFLKTHNIYDGHMLCAPK